MCRLLSKLLNNFLADARQIDLQGPHGILMVGMLCAGVVQPLGGGIGDLPEADEWPMRAEAIIVPTNDSQVSQR